MQGKKQFIPKLYYTFNLDAFVTSDNYYRRLDAVLDLRWLRKETARFYSLEGRPGIDPEVFVKVLLVGYMNNIGSDRALMQTCGNRLDVRWFLGYDLDEPLPCHSTISRTRALWGEQVFERLFAQVLGMCVRKGMVSGKRQAMDAAPFKANASMDSLVEKEVVEDAKSYAAELDAGSEYKVDQYKRKRVEAHHAWKAKTYGQMPASGGKEDKDAHGHLIRPKYLSNHTHYSPTDPDARISVKPGKARQLNYHGQLSVDEHHHVITAAMASGADKRDSQVLPALLDRCMGNLQAHGVPMEQVAADAGYSSSDALRHCNARGIEAYIPNFGQYKPDREGFLYDADRDEYRCTRAEGHRATLPFKKEESNHDGHIMRKYRSSSKDCGKCPLRATCIGRSDFKTITHTKDKALYDAMHLRMQTPKAKRIMRRRSSTVEPVLGTLINFLNMKRINARGMAAAHKHVLMAATCYNLKKYLKTIAQPGKVREKVKETARKGLKTALWFLFSWNIPPTASTVRLTTAKSNC